MRIFIGIKLSVSNILSDVKKHISASKKDKIHWVDKNNLHLTFVYIGQVDKIQQELLSNALNEEMKFFSSFEIKVHNIGVFKKRKGKYILWLGVEDSVVLNQLQKQIMKVCCENIPGMTNELPVYTPHITLGRFSRNLILNEIFNCQISKSICIDEIQMIESVSKLEGIKYCILEKIPLIRVCL